MCWTLVRPCIISIELHCPRVSPAESKPLYVNYVKTMKQELSVTVAVKKREGQMDELFRGSQRRSEVSWGRDDKSHQGMTHTLHIVPVCVCVCFSCQKKKCSSGIVHD